MLKPILIAGAALALAMPAVSNAATRCRQANRDNEAAGTVVGAVAGGFLGNALSHGRSRGAGTAIGAVGGAVIGNRLAAAGNQPCPDGYEVYDDGVVNSRYDQSQYQSYQSGQPVYDEHRYDGYSQPGSQTYSYQQPSYQQRSYTYSQPSYNQQYSYGQQPTYSSGYQEQARSDQYWQDDYGRTCHWSYSRRSADWRKVCR